MPRWFLIFGLVVRAYNVPSIKKNRFLKRKFFVTVSKLGTTARTTDVRVQGQIAKWNQKLDALYVFPVYFLFWWLILPFSLVQPSSHLTICLYAKRSAHPDILIGIHEMPIPLASQIGSFFVENIFLFNQLNVSRADLPCVLGNGIGGTARSTQSVTLYITVNITPPSLHNSPVVRDDSPVEEATIPGRIQSPVPEHALPLSPYKPVETGNTMPQSREDASRASTEDPHLALLRADESMKRVVPIDGSNTWEKAIGRIKWVMDTLGPIAEVRVILF
jgi:hypothetical protein